MKGHLKDMFLYVSGGIVLAVPSLAATENPATFLVPMGIGMVLLAAATIRARSNETATALWLLATLNLSYWLSHGLWFVSRRVVENPQLGGIDPYAGPLAMWLLVFTTVLFYQLVQFFRGLVEGGPRRKLSILGLVGLLVQVLLPMRLAWTLLQGI